MTFITFSLFLGGLAATAIPVFLHFTMRGRPKRIEFPALMFVKKRLEVNRRSYRLKHLILLAMRIAALVLLGLALARPTLKLGDWFASTESRTGAFGSTWSVAGRDAPAAAAIVLDASLRMEYVDANQTRLDRAREFALRILDQLPPGSRVAVLSTERESPVFQVDRLAAEDKIRRLRLVPNGRSVAETTADALTLLAECELDQRELYVLTDLSEPGWPEELASSLRDAVQRIKGAGKMPGIFVADVGVDRPVDTALLRLSPAPQTATPRSTVLLEAEAAHWGPAAVEAVELVLLDPTGEVESVRDTKTIDFPDGESRRQVVFSLTGLEPGTRQGLLRLAVPDALEADDRLWFSLRIDPPSRLLIFAPPPVRDSSLCLRQALETVPFEVDTAPPDQLPQQTAKELQRYRAVVLLDPGPLEPAVWKKLADYVVGGGGVGVFLGPRAQPLASFNDPTATELLGVKLVRQARDPDGELRIVPGDGVSPLLTPFRALGPLERFPWDAMPVYRYWEVADPLDRVETALPYSDGRPAILVQMPGRGRVATVTTPVSQPADDPAPWNELPRGEAQWMFLLLAEGVAKYLVGDARQNYNFLSGEPIILRPNQETVPASALLRVPSGKTVALTPDVRERSIVIPSTAEPGNYRVRSGGERESLDIGFSVNIAEREKNLRRLDVERLDAFFGEKAYRLVRTPQEIEASIARRRVGQELYAVVLILAVAVFATEYAFSNRFHSV